MKGMEAVAEAVLVDALGPVGEILFEEVADLVRVARAGKDPVPDLPVGGVVETVPPVGAGAGQDHGAARPGRVAQRVRSGSVTGIIRLPKTIWSSIVPSGKGVSGPNRSLPLRSSRAVRP